MSEICEIEWLESTVAKIKSALRIQGMSCKIALGKEPILTPNAALITFNGGPDLTRKKLEAAESELLTTHGLPILSIREGIGTLTVAIARDTRAVIPSTKTFEKILSSPDYDPTKEEVFIGLREEDGQPQLLNLFSDPHTLISGATGSGKSVLLQNIIAFVGISRSPEEAHIYLVDGKMGVDYAAIEDLPHLINGSGEIVTEKEESIALIAELSAEMESRYKLFKSSKTSNIRAYREKTGLTLPTIFYMQDEFADWMLDKEYADAISAGVSSIGVKARAAGIFLFFGLQRPDNSVMPMQLRAQLGNRLTLKVTDKGTAEIASGEKNSGCEKLLGQGHMLAKIEGLLIPIQVPFINADELEALVDGIAQMYGTSAVFSVYADANATTPLSPEVISVMAPYWSEKFFNPSSPAGEHYGADYPLRLAKAKLSMLFGGASSNYTLTSGATEANNWAVDLALSKALVVHESCEIITSVTEHPSIREVLRERASQDSRITLHEVPVNSDGILDLDVLKSLLNDKTALVSVMMANNESGVIQPLVEITKLVKSRAKNALIHTDATQAAGKIAVNLDDELFGVDLLSLSAHKFGGPKGIGALFIRNANSAKPFLVGGSQQNGLRGGTENPPLAAGLAKALDILNLNGMEKQIAIRNEFETKLKEGVPGLIILGESAERLPNTTLALFPEQEGESLVLQLLEKKVTASTGAACTAGSDTPSHVVQAMGVNYDAAHNSVRFSFLPNVKETEVLYVVNMLKEVNS